MHSVPEDVENSVVIIKLQAVPLGEGSNPRQH